MATGRPLLALGELMPERGATVDPSKYPDEEFALFSVPAYDSLTPDRVLGKDIGSSKQVVKPGDLLLSKIVPHIRRAWIVPQQDGPRQIGSSEWIIFRSTKFFGPFLRHVLLSDWFNSDLMRTVSGVGGSLLRARPSGVAQIRIPLPAIEEQRRIAEILDRAEELRAKRRAAIALLDQLPQAIFLEMFGDPATNPMNWPIVSVGDLLESAKYGTSGKAGPEGRWPVLRMGNLTDSGELDLRSLKYMDFTDNEVAKYTLKKGDLLFNRTNSVDLVGKTAVFDLEEPFAFAGYLVRLRVNERATSRFIGQFMNLDFTKKVLRGMAKSIVGMANINAREVQTIRIPLTPISLQAEFSGRVEAVHRAKASHQTALAELDDLFASLQAELFGDTPPRRPAPASPEPELEAIYQ